MPEQPNGPERRPLPPMEVGRPAPDPYGKVRGRPGADPDEPVEVVVEVAEAGYHPAGVDVRAQISDTIFTATVATADLAGLDRDPLVVAVELGSSLDQID